MLNYLDYQFSLKTELFSGKGALLSLQQKLNSMGSVRPFIMVPRQCGKEMNSLLSPLFSNENIESKTWVDDLPDEIGTDLMERLLALYKEGRCDSIVAPGSGSFIHGAKALNAALSNNFTVKDLLTKKSMRANTIPMAVISCNNGDPCDSSDRFFFQQREYKEAMAAPDILCIDSELSSFRTPRQAAYAIAATVSDCVEAIATDRTNPVIESFIHGALQLVRSNTSGALKGSKKESIAIINAAYIAGLMGNSTGLGLVRKSAEMLSGKTGHPVGLLQGALLNSYLLIHHVREELLLTAGSFSRYAATAESDRIIEGKAAVEELLKPLFPYIPSDIDDLSVGTYILEETLRDISSDLSSAKNKELLKEVRHWESILFDR
jgi:alcohol dehydrogenase